SFTRIWWGTRWEVLLIKAVLFVFASGCFWHLLIIHDHHTTFYVVEQDIHKKLEEANIWLQTFPEQASGIKPFINAVNRITTILAAEDLIFMLFMLPSLAYMITSEFVPPSG